MSIQSTDAARSLANTRVGVKRHDILVTKQVASQSSGVVEVEYRIESESGAPVELGILDRVPGDDPEIAFHPNVDGENWARKGNLVRYHRRVSPRMDSRTGFALKDLSLREVHRLLGPPVLEVSDAGNPWGSTR